MNVHLPAPVVRAVVAVTALVALSGCLSAPQQSGLDLMNRDRTANGLSPLASRPPDLQAKAQAWADRLAFEGALYHSSLPDGITTRWCGLGENIAYNSWGDNSIARNEAMFMASPGHRANILNPSWNGAGIGIAQRGNTVWTVQEFITTC